MLARLRAEGPLTATQLGGAKAGGPWWDWSDIKIAVEWLLDTGEVICVRRTGWRRVYDLPERVLPDELLGAEPADPECLAYLAGVAAGALGVVTPADLVEYHRLLFGAKSPKDTKRLLTDAALAAGLTPVALAGAKDQAWADPAALAEASAGRRGRNRVTLLSPFDSLIWDRKRTRLMFGFEHSLEAYVPKHKRIHGYFTMPLLAAQLAAGWIRPGKARRWWPARYHWSARPRPSRWPRPCARRPPGSAATTCASSRSSLPSTPPG